MNTLFFFQMLVEYIPKGSSKQILKEFTKFFLVGIKISIVSLIASF